MSKPIKITDTSFQEEVLEADKPVLVDFWAEWCGPCKMVAPIVEEIAEDYGDQIKVCKLDVDANQAAASSLGVMSIPTLILFEDGEVSEKIVGYAPKEKLVSQLGLSVRK
ncbi:MAG: thioredoxin [Halanaerobiaceae bacterium]